MYTKAYITGTMINKLNNSQNVISSHTFCIKIKFTNNDYNFISNNLNKFNTWIIHFLRNNINSDDFNNNSNINTYLNNTTIIHQNNFVDNIESYSFFKDIEGLIVNEHNENNLYNQNDSYHIVH